ncbi:glycosyltransferase family 39 protein [Zoogloea sp.]|uniref:ArnT family glycosyltransferase n=1 Tax=Zoogloea sp. TaxID=49181 RepID=UPI00260914DA|nr:glycosyltransferase family 39 protein [Zoogloea sp.]MDD3354065.1 glycosyltransferase family 39 protein [Zoogloea sp.]
MYVHASSAAGPAGTALGRLIFFLPLAAYLLCLGGAPLFDVDEGAFSEATREMFERNDFLFTYLNGAPRFDKPIFVYWLQSLGYLIFGVSEWAFRLPSALAAIAWSYATYFFARKRVGEDAALIALAVAATALGPFAIGRAATADGLLNCLLALTLFDVWRHLESGARAPLLRAFLWIGLGALTKGPVALVVPGTVSLLYCASRGEWARWAKMVFNPLGLLLLVAIVAPWYAYAYVLHGQDFIDGFILRHNVQRFSGSLEGHGGSAFYYLIAVPLLLLPWSGLFFAALGKLKAGLGVPLQRFLWIWFGFVLVFFSLSGTKLPHYVLYGCTPLFILIGLAARDLRRVWPHLLAPGLLFLLFPLLPKLFDALSRSQLGDGFYRAQLSRALETADTLYIGATVGGLTLWLAVMFFCRLRPSTRLVLTAALQVVLLAGVVVPYAGNLAQGPVKAAGLKARELGEDVVFWRFTTAPSFSVYRQAVTVKADPKPGQLALTRIDRLPPDRPVETVFQQGGVALVRIKP